MTRPRATLVWLFDVDGTLLLTEGAGREAISLALHERFGIRDDLFGIPMAGRTDPLIVADMAKRHSLELTHGSDEHQMFWEATYQHMRTLMSPPRGGLPPGVLELLDAVSAEPTWVSALLTGNVPVMAELKLGAFGIWERFEFGAFGSEAPDRNALARVAVNRAAQRHGVAPDRCIVVGDTEHDIECARAAGAHAVAVATGSRTREQLAQHAPDLLLDDLRDPARLLDWARRL